jgi:hypothetical protein
MKLRRSRLLGHLAAGERLERLSKRRREFPLAT